MDSHDHTKPSIPSHSFASYHLPLQPSSHPTTYSQQLPSFSTAFQTLQTHHHPSVQHLSNHAQWLPSSLAYTQTPVSSLATVVTTLPTQQLPTPVDPTFHQHAHASRRSNQQLPPLVSTLQNTPSAYSFAHPPAEHSQPPQSQSVQSQPPQTPPPPRATTKQLKQSTAKKPRQPSNKKRAPTKRTRPKVPPPPTNPCSNLDSTVPFPSDPSSVPASSPIPELSPHAKKVAPSDAVPCQGKNPAMTFNAPDPDPRVAASALNFADVIVDTSAPPSDAMLSRYSVYRKALTARETVASGAQVTHPQTLPNQNAVQAEKHGAHEEQMYQSGQVNHSMKAPASKRKSAKASRQRITARKRAASVRAGSGVVHQNRDAGHQESTLQCQTRDVHSLGHVQAAQEQFEMQGMERPETCQDTQDKVEMAAEFLASLAQSRGVSFEGEQRLKQTSNTEQTLDCPTQEEAETRRADPAASVRLHAKSGAHLKRAESQKQASKFGMQEGKPPNNSPNFVSRSAYSTPIPGLPPSHLAEPEHAASLPSSSGAMDILDTTPPEHAKATPVGIRYARNLFMTRPSENLPDVSRNHSLVTTPNLPQHCTHPSQPQQQPVHQDSGSSSNPMYPTHHSSLVRPLFEEPAVATHQHAASSMLPQPTPFMYTLSPHHNLTYRQYQPPGGQHSNDTLQPLPQSSQPSTQQAHPPQFQQPPSELPKPSTEFLQSSQQLQQQSPQASQPSVQFSQVTQNSSLPSPQSRQPFQNPTKAPQQRQAPQPAGKVPEVGRTTKARKGTKKKSAPRKPSDSLKPAKPKKKRSAPKTANHKRPRAPKKTLPASSPHKGKATEGNPCTPSVPKQTQLPPIPSLEIPTVTEPPIPDPRLHADHDTQSGAFLTHVPTSSGNRESLSEVQFPHCSQEPSSYVQNISNEESHLRSSWGQQRPVPSSNDKEGHNGFIRGPVVNNTSREAYLQNPIQGNASAENRGGVLEKAHSAAEKAAREGRGAQSVPAERDALYIPQTILQHRQQVLRLHPPLPPPALQSTTLPSTAQPVLPSFQNLNSAQESLGVRPPPAASAYQQVFAGDALGTAANTMILTPERARVPVAPLRGSHAPAQSIDQGQATFSPRTESTQQTLPPDTYSHTPSEMGYPPDAVDNAPPSQARDQTRCSSVANPSDGQPAPEPIRGKSHQQYGADGMFQQGSARLTLTNQSSPPFDGAEQVKVPVSNNAGKPLKNAAKRKKTAKSSSPSKRRKKNQPNSTEQESSTNQDQVKANKGVTTVMEDATANGETKGQKGRKLAYASRQVSSSKKCGKGQAKSKPAQQSKSVQKRASPGAKTQRKNKSNGSKTGETYSPLNGGSGLRLCFSLQKEGGQQSSEATTDPNGDSCDSPDTTEKVCSAPKRASKSPEKKATKPNKQSVKVSSNVVDQKIQTVPCFAEELKNLRTSGILTLTERNSDPSSAEIRNEVIPEVPNTKSCALCQQHGSSSEMIKHPCFPLRVFDICKTCADTVSKRVRENGAKRKEAEVTSEKTITEQTTLFVMLIEEMVRHFTPSDREQRDVNRVYEFISNRNFSELVERGESLSVNFEMLTVLRVLLRKVGFSLRGGKLKWPGGEFTLPSLADTRALVSNSIPARIEDLKRGIFPGEAAWDKTFPDHEKFSSQQSSCAIYENIFGLIGLKLVHVSECFGQSSSGGSCDVRFDAVSIGTLMYRTAAMLAGTVTQELLAKCWTKEEALRFINEVEIGRLNGSFQGATQSCCICGGSGKHLEGSATQRFSNCTECLKSFCSICLLNVLGSSEYLRSFEEDGYCCMLCRLHKNAEINPGCKTSQGMKEHRLRLREHAGIKKGSDRRAKTMFPLLLLSQKVRADVLLRSELPTSRESLGFAMFCEVVNENSARCRISPQSSLNSHDRCLECKLPVDDKKLGEESDSLRCGHGNCPNVMHKTCMAPNRQVRRRGSRSKWCCPHHQCSKCEQHDESKLLRCRTCPVTYCKEHMPLPREVYVFSEKSFACFKCRTSLRIPQHLRLKLSCSKSERKRNAIAQALAIDQRKRSSVVKKLSEGPGPKFFEASAFNELRITT